MNRWYDELQASLNALDSQGLRRCLTPVLPGGRLIRVNGRPCINLSSNDYLALADDPRLKDAAVRALSRWGTGAGASRLVTGHLPIHAEVEARFARFKHAESALILPTGFMANLAVLGALAAPGDLVCVDKLSHASLLDAARASGAQVRVYPHLDLRKLERLLARHHRDGLGSAAAPTGRTPRRFIVTDSVFSMDGDTADLPSLCALAERYEGITVIDEAHGTGVLGTTGAGLCEFQGVADRVDIVVSTASKALGGLGGIVTARSAVIQTLVNRGRSFIYTTAVPAVQAAVILAALEVVDAEPERRERLRDLASAFQSELQRLGLTPAASQGEVVTPIHPIVVGTVERADALSVYLREQGFYALAIRPPTVAKGTARVRISMRADLEPDDIDRLVTAIADWMRVNQG